MTMRYAIVIEQAGSGYSAYVPDLPGCIATGLTVSDVQAQMLRAIELHLGRAVASARAVFRATALKSRIVDFAPRIA